jgi:tetratricopeptide (TPR) repeat protein
MVKFKHNKNRSTAPAAGIVVGGGAEPEKPKKTTAPKMIKGSEIGHAEKAAKNKLHLKQIALLVIVLVVLSTLSIVGLKAYQRSSNHNKQVNTALADLEDDSKKPGYNTISQNADAIINKANTKEEKIETYLRLASVAAGAQDNEKAIEYYEAAGALDEDTAQKNAYVLAMVYEADGNKPKAIENYTVALKYYSEVKPDPQLEGTDDNSYYIQTIQEKLKQLEG